MNSLINDLSLALNSKNDEKILNVLQKIQTQGTNIELENIKLTQELFALKNTRIDKLFLEILAEWCKTENNRKIFTDKTIIDQLLEFLESDDEELIVSAIRALGNICYENEEARKIIDKKGLSIVISILKLDKERKNDSLTLKASGFLVNLLMGSDDLQKAALKYNIVNIVEELLNKYKTDFNENKLLITFLLTILNNVIDYIEDQNVPFTDSLCCTIIEIFKVSQTPEISVSCLEILHGQSDKDEVKTLLAKHGTCELVFDLIEKYRGEVNDEESRSVMKMACDLIVIVLTGDDCMNMLYNNGKGKVFENMKAWLDSDDPDLLSTGILAIGNFARKDIHCIQMVQNGISKKLIELLKKYNKKDSDIKVQHALLSTMKNLVIPKPNKAKILEEGLIDTIYPMIHIEQYLVIFKLLGTFRMVIDGQEAAALDLLSRKDFIEQLIHWCYNSDHLGVRGEVPRLLSWLIKHSHSFKPFKELLKIKDSVKCLVEMCSSNHAVMQNESFYALHLLCLNCLENNNTKQNGNLDGKTPINNGDNDDNVCLSDLLINAEIGKNLHFVINKYGDKMDKNTIENLLTLLEQLSKSENVLKHLKLNNIGEALIKLNSNAKSNECSEKLKTVIDKINAV